MSLKLYRYLKRSRPLAKEQKIAEFRHRYVIFLTVWICAGTFPSILWISLGRSSGAWPLETLGYLWLLGASFLAYNKFLYIYEARLLNIYPSIEKLTKKQLRSLRFNLGLACAFPLAHLGVIAALWNKKRCPKDNPFFLREPLKTYFALAGVGIIFPLFLILSTLQTKIPTRALPSFITYWISNPSMSAFNSIRHDTERTLVWMKETKERVVKEKLDHAAANEIYTKKSNSPEISRSPIAPILISFGSTGTHMLADKNLRSLSSEGGNNLSKLYVYESFVSTWKAWNPSLFYAFNPVALLSPVGAYEFALLSLTFKWTTSKMKADYRERTIEGLNTINSEIASNASAVTAKSKIKKLKRELEVKD